jgi:hypothetical protein
MTNQDHVSAAVRAVAAVGTSTAYASAAAIANLAALRAALTTTTCTHPSGCTNPATHQTTRPATTDETEAHWTATEQHIRSANSGTPDTDYTADRADTVTITEHRCDHPDHADPTYLEATARQATDG